jgi:hypothetical protein
MILKWKTRYNNPHWATTILIYVYWNMKHFKLPDISHIFRLICNGEEINRSRLTSEISVHVWLCKFLWSTFESSMSLGPQFLTHEKFHLMVCHIHAKFHNDRFRNSSSTKGITSNSSTGCSVGTADVRYFLSTPLSWPQVAWCTYEVSW